MERKHQSIAPPDLSKGKELGQSNVAEIIIDFQKINANSQQLFNIKQQKMTLSEKLLGNNRESIPNWAFKLMAFVMKIMDVCGYHDKNFKTLGIKKGQTVIDYGCGPARYTCRISSAIGNEGRLIATDIHPCLLYTSPSPRDRQKSRMPSSA
eukprot:TRINITY_DN4140_c0_g1_i1.p7 TRINITY_DN4140_c0_g1~~TRINITY_DN4140_c0_g1_i1.p7  ORF type:complete len:152 (+),score=16.44 TRINITY_DN4140_c0_g1_i1:2139-2594(+)